MSDGWRAYVPEIERALARAGVSSIRAYLRAHPTASPVQLGDQLGLRPILVTFFALDRAGVEGWLPELARDVLARELRDSMPDGWGHGRDGLSAQFARARAIGAWATAMDRKVDDEMRAAVAVLDEQAPIGWRPEGPDDALVVEVVRRLYGLPS